MKSYVIIWILFVYTCVSTNGTHLFGATHEDQDYISSDVHNQRKTHITTNGKQLQGDTDGNQDYISSDLHNQIKTHVIQDYHQPEYYGSEKFCPAAEDIAPCVCTYNIKAKANDIDCSAVMSEEELKQIFKKDFPFTFFRKFKISTNGNLKVLEKSVFNDISFEVIHLEYTTVDFIEMNAFESCYEMAYKLHFEYNRLIDFPFGDLPKFSKLKNFFLMGNNLLRIPANAFNGLTTLQSLNIQEYYAVIDGTFENIPNLKIFSLGLDELKTIPTNFINTGSPYLHIILMDSNDIVSVESGAFEIVEGLQIYIMDNLISTLEEGTWRQLLEAGGGLHPNGNPLTCGCDIAWLFQEDQLIQQVGKWTECNDGKNIHDLDPEFFDNC